MSQDDVADREYDPISVNWHITVFWAGKFLKINGYNCMNPSIDLVV